MKKHVLIGVTGGIAAYKILDLISNLRKQDIEISVVMTENACEFVTPLTFQTVSGNKVHTEMFKVAETWAVEHIELAKKADVVLVAPATANCIGKVAAGIADDMLTTILMATKAPIIFAPAMNTNMYLNPLFQENVKKLKSLGYEFIEPASGQLACGDIGVGKLAPIDEIAQIVVAKVNAIDGRSERIFLPHDVNQDLSGKKILVTAGPTIEAIDPVRYITNHSSGKMGFAIAEAAFARGAEVTLVSGPVNLTCSQGINRVDIKSTGDMLVAVKSRFDGVDAVIKAAAPADYRPAEISDKKIKKKQGDLTVTFVRNLDILETLGKMKGDKVLVGFAAETDDLVVYAKDKIKRKNLDFIVANNVALEGAGFKQDTNIITIIDGEENITEYDKMSKKDAAHVILDKLKQYF